MSQSGFQKTGVVRGVVLALSAITSFFVTVFFTKHTSFALAILFGTGLTTATCLFAYLYGYLDGYEHATRDGRK